MGLSLKPSLKLCDGHTVMLFVMVSTMVLLVVIIVSKVHCDDGQSERRTKFKLKFTVEVLKEVDPERCTMKSENGDVLHVHYTVGGMLSFNVGID